MWKIRFLTSALDVALQLFFVRNYGRRAGTTKTTRKVLRMERWEDLDGEEQEEKCCTGKFLHNLCALFHKSATWAICSMLRTNFYLLFTSPSSPDCEDGWGLGRAVLVCEALGLRRQSSVWARAMDAVTRGVKLLKTRAANRAWSCSKLTFLMKQISPKTCKKISPGRISQLWSISIFSKLSQPRIYKFSHQDLRHDYQVLLNLWSFLAQLFLIKFSETSK